MSLTSRDTGGGESFEPIAAGMHHAVCYAVIDIGTPPQFGKFPSRPKVLFCWEVPGERIELEKNGEKLNLPRAISQRYTNTLASKGNLRPMLESWRGRAFTPEELDGFDLKHVVGANCLLNIVHANGTGDKANKVYANVSTVSPLMKGMNKLKPENPPLTFSLEDFPPGTPVEFPANMPEWIINTIKESEEFKDHQRPKPHEPERGPQPAFDPSNSGIDEDVPF